MTESSIRYSKERLYSIRKGMMQRCYYEKHSGYADYGGRGISICDEWRRDYHAFRTWALANGYEDGLTIDRDDTNGNYEPSNCRWVSRARQMRNLRRNTCSEQMAIEVRELYRSGAGTMRALAARFNLGLAVVHGCIHQTKWQPLER